MPKFAPLFLVVALGVFGCGVQHGQFVTTGDTGYLFLSPVGSIDIIDGYETKSAHETGILNEQHLLYLLVITPFVQEHGSSGNSDFGEHITTLSYAWNTEKGAQSVSVSWNRQTDTVTIGKQEFIREKGNVFIARLNANGEISGQQLASLDPHVCYQDVLKYIQHQLPDDKLLSSVKLYK